MRLWPRLIEISLPMDQASVASQLPVETALKVARFLEGRVPEVLHPGLPSHPQHDLAMSQMAMAGPIFAIRLDGGRAQAHGLLDALQLIDISNNIGDSRSLMTHPASTTHSGVAEDKRGTFLPVSASVDGVPQAPVPVAMSSAGRTALFAFLAAACDTGGR